MPFDVDLIDELADWPPPSMALSDWLRDHDVVVLAALARAARANGTTLLGQLSQEQ